MIEHLITSFTIGDVDEPELVMDMIVSARLRSTKAGQWVLDNCKKIRYNYSDGAETEGGYSWYYRVNVFAEFADDKLATEYCLRFK